MTDSDSASRTPRPSVLAPAARPRRTEGPWVRLRRRRRARDAACSIATAASRRAASASPPLSYLNVYHALLTVTWPRFLGLATAAYLA